MRIIWCSRFLCVYSIQIVFRLIGCVGEVCSNYRLVGEFLVLCIFLFGFCNGREHSSDLVHYSSLSGVLLCPKAFTVQYRHYSTPITASATVVNASQIDTVLYMNIHTYVYRDSGSSPWGLYQCPKLGQVFHISRIRNEKEQTLLEALSTGGQKGTTTS
jgi:hypothetical protein